MFEELTSNGLNLTTNMYVIKRLIQGQIYFMDLIVELTYCWFVFLDIINQFLIVI